MVLLYIICHIVSLDIHLYLLLEENQKKMLIAGFFLMLSDLQVQNHEMPKWLTCFEWGLYDFSCVYLE